jgi:hypothetical protein
VDAPKEDDHDCLTNFEGSSGSMESAALVLIAHSLLDEEHVLLGTIVADDDSSMRAHMKYYNPGEGFNACLPIIDESVKLCRAGCGGTDHKTSQSRKCSFNTQNKQGVAQRNKDQESKEIEAIIQSQGNMMYK